MLLLVGGARAWAEEPETVSTTAVYSLDGLHCPPCASTVERSLKRAAGVRSARVDYRTKSAQIEFDESKLSAQKLAKLIAATPHMMGGDMHYSGLLTLHVAGLADETNAKRATDALQGVPGIAKVQVRTKQKTVAVRFTPKGDATTQQVLAALASAGLQATLKP
ncbi:MAG: heavy-metal-associated domain-containing protein [Pirellulales bacterium]